MEWLYWFEVYKLKSLSLIWNISWPLHTELLTIVIMFHELSDALSKKELKIAIVVSMQPIPAELLYSWPLWWDWDFVIVTQVFLLVLSINAKPSNIPPMSVN